MAEIVAGVVRAGGEREIRDRAVARRAAVDSRRDFADEVACRRRLGHGVGAGKKIGEVISTACAGSRGQIDRVAVRVLAGQRERDVLDRSFGAFKDAVIIGIEIHITRDLRGVGETGVFREIVLAGDAGGEVDDGTARRR